MFCLSEIEHTLRLPPHLLNLPLAEAIKGELECLFLDKVIAKLGLCISVYDIRSIDGGFVFPGDGASTYTVKFRLIIFRPFVGEVIAARLKESSSTGLRLSLGFFDDIYVPVSFLARPSFPEPDPDNKKQVRWIWKYGDQNFPIDGVDEIRFRVQSVIYPPIPLEQERDSKPFAPMVVTVSAPLFFRVFDTWPISLFDFPAEVMLLLPMKGRRKDERAFNSGWYWQGSLDADGLGPISWWV